MKQKDIKEAFVDEGHTVIVFSLSKKERYGRYNLEVERRLLSRLHTDVPDIVVSFDYFSMVSKICNEEKIRYISWIYDCPQGGLYSYTIINSCNTVYAFDKELYLEFHRAGITTVHYLPLAANIRRLDAMECGEK